MNSQPLCLHRATQRARWLAELATTLDRADALTLELSDQRSDSANLTALRRDIGALRTKVDCIQRGQRPSAEQIHPNWMS